MCAEFSICYTVESHIAKVQKLIDQNTVDAFGKINLLNIFERSLLSLTVFNGEDEIVGCACFSDAPSRKYSVRENWYPWFKSTVGLSNVSSENSLFLQFITLSTENNTEVLREICQTVFISIIEVNNIFMVTDAKSNFFLSKILPFHTIPTNTGSDDIIISAVYRHEIFPVLFSRIATVEDNDDLVPLFNAQTEMLRKTYGNYYIAELVEAQNEELKCVVVESERRAVGFISGTRRVDFETLNEQYDLSVFHGLRKPHDNDILHKPTASDFNTPPASIQESTTSKEEQIEPQDLKKSLNMKCSEEENPQPWIRRNFLEEANHSEEFIPTYVGEPNAFAIQLYALKPGFESRFIDMLPLLFDQFPGLDYAIICVSRLTPTFPMLRQFARCRRRKGQDPADELYVFHRSGLLGDFVVRRTKHNDKEQIKQLVSRMDTTDQKILLDDLDAYIHQGRDKDGAVITSFVAVSMGRVVGVVILRDEQQIEWIRAHYDIERFINYGHHARGEHAAIYHFALAANYHCRRTLFLREVMRLANKTCFYYQILPAYSKDMTPPFPTLITCLSDLVPVPPRRQINYPPKEVLGEKAPEQRTLNHVEDPPALFMSTVKLVAKPRHEVNSRIIVVGASTTGLAVLTTLATCPYLRFTNLVLLSPNGLPGDALEKPDPLALKFLPTDHCYPIEFLGQYGLRHCVHVVRGKLTGVDRKFKFITIDHNKRLSFDYLVITTGLQYHICCPGSNEKLKEPIPYETPFRRTRRFSLEFPTGIRPTNLFLINDCLDATRVIHWVRTKYLSNMTTEELNVPDWKKKKVENVQAACADADEDREISEEDMEDFANKPNQLIIYGYNLNCYTCVAALLECGVPGWCIRMIQPPRLEGDKLPFEDKNVSSTVKAELAKAEVRVIRGYTLLEWDNNEPPSVEELNQITFIGDKRTLKVQCKALFCFYEKTVDFDLFMAANNACFVFDARLSVDINFHTNDPAVRAAGPVTKLQRLYYNDQWRHELANSHEVGSLLGQQLLDLFNPEKDNPVMPPKDNSHLLPQFSEPKVVGGRLPGDFNYLYISKPSLNDLSKEISAENSGGRVITTGIATEGNGYFSLHINKFGTVQTITCLSKKKIPIENYIQLYRVHAQLLNKLVARFDEGLVTDLYEFLNDVWPIAIYHDRFPEAEAEAHDMLYGPGPNGETILANTVQELLASKSELTESDMEKLKEIYVNEGYKEMVERHLLKFINKNYNTLPMYAKPDLV